MNPSKFVLALTVLALGAGPSVAPAGDGSDNHSHERHFEARLFGANEGPPLSTRAQGRLRATLNHSETELTFQLSWEDLTADAAVAHIHFGPSRVNGGVMVFFCGGGRPAPPPPPPPPPPLAPAGQEGGLVALFRGRGRPAGLPRGCLGHHQRHHHRRQR